MYIMSNNYNYNYGAGFQVDLAHLLHSVGDVVTEMTPLASKAFVLYGKY